MLAVNPKDRQVISLAELVLLGVSIPLADTSVRRSVELDRVDRVTVIATDHKIEVRF